MPLFGPSTPPTPTLEERLGNADTVRDGGIRALRQALDTLDAAAQMHTTVADDAQNRIVELQVIAAAALAAAGRSGTTSQRVRTEEDL